HDAQHVTSAGALDLPVAGGVIGARAGHENEATRAGLDAVGVQVRQPDGADGTGAGRRWGIGQQCENQGDGHRGDSWGNLDSVVRIVEGDRKWLFGPTSGKTCLKTRTGAPSLGQTQNNSSSSLTRNQLRTNHFGFGRASRMTPSSARISAKGRRRGWSIG